MDEVRICPLDTTGRYHPGEMKQCPHCDTEMETYHRRRDDPQEEGMALDGSSFKADAILVATVVLIIIAFAYAMSQTT